MLSKFKFKLEKIADNHEAIAKGIEEAVRTAAYAGVPENKTGRKDEGPINNASLMYIQEHGSDKNKLPARPAMTPGIKNAKEAIAGHLRAAAKRALNGDVAGVNREYSKAGQTAADSIKKMFVDNDWRPLKRSTLRAKGAKKVTDSETGKEKWVGKTRPLIDTGQLRKSITYVVEKK